MSRNHQGDEFVAVRVQDPRIQNEGNWNSYVDYKIFLHTNSKAFTAKTSCVRRRYSEFVWLKKKLQKNSGLVPVPDLPGKSFFSFSNEDFLEKRRRGLQAFLDKVVHMTVCLSDSQLHLFLQTQLTLSHIEDCVQGLTPYSVTDAILTYASSNQGLAQAQEEDAFREPSLTVSYESMESPAPHQPSLQTNTGLVPEPPANQDPLKALLGTSEQKPDGTTPKISIQISQKSDCLKAIVEDHTEATFYVGNTPNGSDDGSCLIQTPVEVYSPMETACVVNCTEGSWIGGNVEDPDSEGKKSPEKSNLRYTYSGEMAIENSVEGREDVLEKQPVDLKIGELQGQILNVYSKREEKEEQDDPSDREEEVFLQSEIYDKTDQTEPVKEEQEPETKDDSDESFHSQSSSNESIIKCSEEDSPCEEAEDLIQAESIYEKTSLELTVCSQVNAPCKNMLDLHVNGCILEEVNPNNEDLQLITNICNPPDVDPAVVEADLTENSDFSVLGSSRAPGSTDSKNTEQGTLSSLSLDATEDT